MKIRQCLPIMLFSALSSIVMAAAPAPNQNTAASPDKVRKQFDAVASHLDTGGELYAIANVDGMLEGFVSQIVGLTSLAPTNEPGGDAVRSAARKVPAFLQTNGFYACRCCGISSIPRPDGLSSIKLFLSRDPSAAGLPLWKGIVGGTKQRKLACADFLPADTVMVRVFNGNLSQVWSLARQGVKDIAEPSTATAFDHEISNISSNLNADLDKLIASIGDEGFFSIQLSRDSTVTLPKQDPQASIPDPSFLIGLAINDNSLPTMLDNRILKQAMPVVKTRVGDVTLQSVNIPLSLPFPVQVTYAVCSNYLLLGSNPQVVSDAVSAFQKKDGLLVDPEFNKLFKGLPEENNGFGFVSEKFARTLMDLEMHLVEARQRDNQAASTVMRNLMTRFSPKSSAFAILNSDDGVLVQATSAASGQDIVAQLTMMPVGLLAAVAIPSFTKARSTSQKNACINNLKMLDAAKEQWALENGKKDGDIVDPEGLKKYLKGGKMPVCPGGGTYRLNPVGVMPECSILEHKLNW